MALAAAHSTTSWGVAGNYYPVSGIIMLTKLGKDEIINHKDVIVWKEGEMK